MKKYSVTLLEHVRHTYEVKANNEEQAVQLATERSDFDDAHVDMEVSINGIQFPIKTNITAC
jgi:hypothetical protein